VGRLRAPLRLTGSTMLCLGEVRGSMTLKSQLVRGASSRSGAPDQAFLGNRLSSRECRPSGTASGVQPKILLKTNLTPSEPFHRTKFNTPLDLQSSILIVPLVPHVSECSTIRTAFALPSRDDNGAETSTGLAEKGKARSGRNLGVVLPHDSTI
jgi:hypothetical protein